MRVWLSFVVCMMVGACSVKVKQPTYASPEQTFATWLSAAERLDYETLIQCYARAHQDRVRKSIQENTLEGLRATQEEVRETEFVVEKVVYEGEKAYLRVLRKRGKDREIEVLNMVKERGEWKLIP